MKTRLQFSRFNQDRLIAYRKHRNDCWAPAPHKALCSVPLHTWFCGCTGVPRTLVIITGRGACRGLEICGGSPPPRRDSTWGDGRGAVMPVWVRDEEDGVTLTADWEGGQSLRAWRPGSRRAEWLADTGPCDCIILSPHDWEQPARRGGGTEWVWTRVSG